MTDAYIHSVAVMGTVVTIQVVGHGETAARKREREAGVARAAEWFHEIERSCSRFDSRSELRSLSAQIGVAVPVSAMLYEAVRFALAVAIESDGAFDPTVGLQMERRGFDREHRSGGIVTTLPGEGTGATYRDVHLDDDQRTITLLRPLLLDLGAVAKGLAIDVAARELQSFTNFAIDAGGDLYFGGCKATGELWSVGIRHPRDATLLLATLSVSDRAVCTSGDYERRTDAGHHIVDARTGSSANDIASVTVVSPSAMVSDTLATAAFVLGPTDGLALLERHGMEGLILTPSLERLATRGMPFTNDSLDARADVAHTR